MKTPKEQISQAMNFIKEINIKNNYTDKKVIFIGDDYEKLKLNKNPRPSCLDLTYLRDRTIRLITGNVTNINVITDDNKYVYCDESIVDVFKEDMKFKQDKIIGDSNVVSVDSGLNHTVIITAFNFKPGKFSTYVFARGSNEYCQLGLNDNIERSEFARLRCLENKRFINVVCGPYTTFLLTDTCEVYGFGNNRNSQLGIDAEKKTVSVPTLVNGLNGIHVIAIAAGLKHSLALSSTGLVFGTGSNDKNELGSNNYGYSRFTLIESLKDFKMVKIASSKSISASMDENGDVYIWGDEYGFPPKIEKSKEPNFRYIDFALGNDSRLCLLSDSGNIYVSGFYTSQGNLVTELTKFPEYSSIYSVFSVGEGFMLCNGSGVSYWNQKSPHYYVPTLLPLDLPYLEKKELIHPTNTLFLHCNLFPRLVIFENLEFILVELFSSLSCLNGCFLNDHFYEFRSDDCGLNFEIIESFYKIFDNESKRSMLSRIEKAFADAIQEKILNSREIERRPCHLRFILIGLMHPSLKKYNSLNPYELWINILKSISKLNAYEILTGWLQNIDIKYFKIMTDSLAACVSEVGRRSGSFYSIDTQHAINAYEIFYKAALRKDLLKYSYFYLDSLSNNYDFSIEFNSFMRTEVNTVVQFSYSMRAPWVLSAAAKTSLVQRIFRSKMDDFINLSNNANLGKFLLQVNRNSILQSTISRFRSLNLLSKFYEDSSGDTAQVDNDVLHKKLKIIFEGEQGIDAGGLQREYFEIIIKEIFQEKDLFVDKGTFYWFNKAATSKESIKMYYITGLIIGLAVFNANILDLYFPNILYKKIKGIRFNLRDLEEFDYQLYNSLEDILNYEGDLKNDYGLTFEYEDVELIPGGANEYLTNSNREEYVDAVITYIFYKSIKYQFEAFKEGFLSVIIPRILDLFRPEELSLLVSGQQELNFHELEENTTYDGYTVESKTIKNFWYVIHEKFNIDEKRQFLYFATSFKRAPLFGLKFLNFTITRDPNKDHLPIAHTCACMVVLPDYSTREELETKLRYALQNFEGFQFK